MRKVKPASKGSQEERQEGRVKNKDEGGGTQRWQSELRRHATGEKPVASEARSSIHCGHGKGTDRKDCRGIHGYAILAGRRLNARRAVSSRSNGRRKRTAGV
jgi:hypothetical protein